ncbi:hypothetical protein O0L34_g6020 [Tuta absoluta]|nr:hypothetical protein O0L34_g6020 [Tuta absoluta]
MPEGTPLKVVFKRRTFSHDEDSRYSLQRFAVQPNVKENYLEISSKQEKTSKNIIFNEGNNFDAFARIAQDIKKTNGRENTITEKFATEVQYMTQKFDADICKLNAAYENLLLKMPELAVVSRRFDE